MRAFLALAIVAPLVSAHAFIPIRRQDDGSSVSASATATSSAAASTSTSFNASDIPECAQTCFYQARNQTTDCPNGSISCLCAQPEVNGYIASCLEGSCATADLESAAQYGTALCYAVWKAEQNGSSTAYLPSTASASATASSDYSASADATSTWSDAASSTWSDAASSTSESAAESSSSAWSSAAETSATSTVVSATATSTTNAANTVAAVASKSTSSSSESTASSSNATSGAMASIVQPWLLTIAGIAAASALML